MTRTVTAARDGGYRIWGSDSGGPTYSFGNKDMLANERVVAVTVEGSRGAPSYRLFDDGLAVEMHDGATYPQTITITLSGGR